MGLLFIRSLIYIALFFGASFAIGKEVRLFDSSGEQIYDYKQELDSLQRDDVLVFDQKKFKIESFIGEGRTTRIYSIGEGRAIRLPLNRGAFSKNLSYANYIQEYYLGYENLKNSKVPIPKVYIEESDPQKYLIVEELKTSFNLYEFLQEKNRVNIKNWHNIYAELKKFARLTSEFTYIEDAHIKQIVWTNKGWVLLDFMSRAKKSSDSLENFNHSIFLNMADLPQNIKQDLHGAVLAEREKKFTGIKELFKQNKIKEIFNSLETTENFEVIQFIIKHLAASPPTLELKKLVGEKTNRPLSTWLDNDFKRFLFIQWRDVFFSEEAWINTPEADNFLKRTIDFDGEGIKWAAKLLSHPAWSRKANSLDLFYYWLSHASSTQAGFLYDKYFSASISWSKLLFPIKDVALDPQNWAKTGESLKKEFKKNFPNVTKKTSFFNQICNFLFN